MYSVAELLEITSRFWEAWGEEGGEIPLCGERGARVPSARGDHQAERGGSGRRPSSVRRVRARARDPRIHATRPPRVQEWGTPRSGSTPPRDPKCSDQRNQPRDPSLGHMSVAELGWGGRKGGRLTDERANC
ncbi:hypothetical protein VPH35_119872 [Triticum aestivum]